MKIKILHGNKTKQTKTTTNLGNDFLQISNWEETFATYLIENKLIYTINKELL